VEACAVKLAGMEGERTRPAVPDHGESTAAESAAAESTAAEAATHGMRAHPAMRAHPTVSAAAVSTTAVPTTAVSAASTRRRNGWSKGNRRTDCNGRGESHDALSEHGSVPP
jgi:hypothetical protein